MDPNLIHFILWFALVPAAVGQIASTLTTGELFERPRAYVQARWPGGLLAYFVTCPYCQSHWLTLPFVFLCPAPVFLNDILVWAGHGWIQAKVGYPLTYFIVWFAAVRIATRFWLDKRRMPNEN
jgi:hypothetical protein